MFDWMEILEISRPRHNLHVAEIFIEAFFCDMAGDMVLLREATVTRKHCYDAGAASDRSPSSQSANDAQPRTLPLNENVLFFLLIYLFIFK